MAITIEDNVSKWKLQRKLNRAGYFYLRKALSDRPRGTRIDYFRVRKVDDNGAWLSVKFFDKDHITDMYVPCTTRAFHEYFSQDSELNSFSTDMMNNYNHKFLEFGSKFAGFISALNILSLFCGFRQEAHLLVMIAASLIALPYCYIKIILPVRRDCKQKFKAFALQPFMRTEIKTEKTKVISDEQVVTSPKFVSSTERVFETDDKVKNIQAAAPWQDETASDIAQRVLQSTTIGGTYLRELEKALRKRKRQSQLVVENAARTFDCDFKRYVLHALLQHIREIFVVALAIAAISYLTAIGVTLAVAITFILGCGTAFFVNTKAEYEKDCREYTDSLMTFLQLNTDCEYLLCQSVTNECEEEAKKLEQRYATI